MIWIGQFVPQEIGTKKKKNVFVVVTYPFYYFIIFLYNPNKFVLNCREDLIVDFHKNLITINLKKNHDRVLRVSFRRIFKWKTMYLWIIVHKCLYMMRSMCFDVAQSSPNKLKKTKEIKKKRKTNNSSHKEHQSRVIW